MLLSKTRNDNYDDINTPHLSQVLQEIGRTESTIYKIRHMLWRKMCPMTQYKALLQINEDNQRLHRDRPLFFVDRDVSLFKLGFRVCRGP